MSLAIVTDLRKFRTLARNWEAFADTDPLFGVLSDPTKFGGKWDAAEFFASGRAHVQKLLRTLADARAPFEPGTCLDFGCGVGRLTVPLSESFTHTVGIDVARPMIAAARQHMPAGARCEFVVNREPDLSRFPSGSFDVVHSCLVLQHVPPEVSVQYIAEFFRVTRPGGLVVFQVPALVRTEGEITAAHALPESAFAARIVIVDPPRALEAGAFSVLTLRVTNLGDTIWPHDIPAGRHICAGNHWLRDDGTTASLDDGRAYLPHSVDPAQTIDIPLTIQAPELPGCYVVEIDLVQEHVSWFTQKGSSTARATIEVTGARPDGPPEPVTSPAALEPTGSSAPRAPLWRRLVRRIRGGTPTFEMHVIARDRVEQIISSSGGRLIKAVDDNAAGAGWLSYTYICRRD